MDWVKMAQEVNEFERLRYVYLNQIVETKAKKDFDFSVDSLGKSIGPFKVGNYYKMEYYLAATFLKNDILELIEPLDVQKIQKLAFNESRSNEINKIDKNTYVAIREHMDVLAGKLQRKLIPDREFKSFNSNVQDLITVRMRKISNYSQTQQNMKILQLFSDEERLLLNDLTSEIIKWRTYFGSIGSPKKKE